MAVIETWFNQDLKNAVKVQYLDGNVFSADNGGNRVGVNVFDNGSAASLSGSVSANVIRADGATIAVSGTLSGNSAYVDLPQAAYAVPGVISIVIKLTTGSVITTLCAVVANVYQSVTDSAVDPGTIIPSIQTLIAEIEAAVASIPADYSSLWASLAPNFSNTVNYAIGEYVTYNGGLYRFIAAHSAGTWSSADVVSITLGEGVADNNKAIDGFALNEDVAFLCDIIGKFIRRSDGSEGDSAAMKCSDFIKIPEGAKAVKVGASYYLGPTQYHLVSDAVFYDANKTFISALYTANTDYAEAKIPQDAVYVRFSQPNERYSTVNNVVGGVWFINPISSRLGLVGSYTFTFTTTKEIKTSDIVLEPNGTYLIRAKAYREKRVRFFPVSDSSEYAQIQPFMNEIVLTNNVNARQYLSAYNVDGTAEVFGVDVFQIGSVEAKQGNISTKYVVSKTVGSGDFTSITECFLALKDDHSPKIVEIWEGNYDIYQEYLDANVPIYTGNDPAMEFVPYCVFIPENTQVIGRGIVKLYWTPDPAQNNITWMQCYAVSPVNVMGSMTLENVEIHCKNGRYCIHNDTIGLAPYAGAVQKFINVKCYKYIGDSDSTTTPGETHIYGTSHCIGYGITRSQQMIFENCLFNNEWDIGRGFYGHTNVKWNGNDIVALWSGEIILKDCIVNTAGNNSVYLQNSGTEQRRIRTKFCNCYISGNVLSVGDGVKNQYDITFLNCGDVRLHYDDSSNPFPPAAYRTTITNV